MAVEQMAWRKALSRPMKDEKRVKEGLKRYLKWRHLTHWELKKFDSWDDMFCNFGKTNISFAISTLILLSGESVPAEHFLADTIRDMTIMDKISYLWNKRQTPNQEFGVRSAVNALVVSFYQRGTMADGIRKAYLNGLLAILPVHEALGYVMAK